MTAILFFCVGCGLVFWAMIAEEIGPDK